MSATAKRSHGSICITKSTWAGGVVEYVKYFSHLVPSPNKIWLLYII